MEWEIFSCNYTFQIKNINQEHMHSIWFLEWLKYWIIVILTLQLGMTPFNTTNRPEYFLFYITLPITVDSGSSKAANKSQASLTSATRWATDMAATLLGWVQATAFLPLERANSTHHWGICVVLPEPVSPTNTMVWWRSRRSKNFVLYSQTGSPILFLWNAITQ